MKRNRRYRGRYRVRYLSAGAVEPNGQPRQRGIVQGREGVTLGAELLDFVRHDDPEAHRAPKKRDASDDHY